VKKQAPPVGKEVRPRGNRLGEALEVLWWGGSLSPLSRMPSEEENPAYFSKGL